MPEDGIRSTYSQCPFQIQMYDSRGIISTGSAFYFVHDGEWFLITNWHNLSGRHAFSKGPLLNPPRFPVSIKAKLATYIDDTRNSFTTVAHPVQIFDEDVPLWYEHPQLGSNCDVVALPVARPDSCPPYMHNAANAIGDKRVPVEPGTTVFVLGFPRGISVGIGLPLWKSCYTASEPYYDVTIGGSPSVVGGLEGGTTVPAFFIDSQTRAGMSGAPVFASYTGAWDTSDPYAPLDFDDPEFLKRDDVILSGRAIEFVGCYSGRSGGNEEEAALGLCWRRDVIEAICASKTLGAFPHGSG